MLASIDFSQQELRWLAIYTQDPALLEVYQKGLDMHSRVTCQIYGLNYDMFEQIRNYKAETNEETEANIKKALEDWKYTQEIEYAISLYNQKNAAKLPEDTYNDTLITDLAGFFELLRKKTKSVVFGKAVAEVKPHSKQGRLSA